jgi:hypothetical protein
MLTRKLTHEDRVRETAYEWVCNNTINDNGKEIFIGNIEDITPKMVTEINLENEYWLLNEDDTELFKQFVINKIESNKIDGLLYILPKSSLQVRYKITDDGVITMDANRHKVEFKLFELKNSRAIYTPKYYINKMNVKPRKIVKGETLDNSCVWAISLIKEYIIAKGTVLPKCVVTA